MTPPTTARRVGHLLGGTAIACLMAMVTVLPAQADPGMGGMGSITVHKYEKPADGSDFGKADGRELNVPGSAKPLANVGFKACWIQGIDLSKSPDWLRLEKLTATQSAAGQAPVVSEGGSALTISCGAEVKTGADGAASLSMLNADRAYVVYESTPPSNATTDSVTKPTILSVPYPGTDAAPGWNYSPHIYPKNVLVGSGAAKNGVIIGNEISYDVVVPINSLGKDANNQELKYTEFKIEDTLSATLNPKTTSVKLRNASDVEVSLTQSTDYTLGVSGQKVTLTLLTPGLAKLDANHGGKLVLTIGAEAIADGTSANTAKVTINGGGSDITDPEPENVYKDAHILKHAQNRGAASTTPLAGAEFELYTQKNGATIASCPATAVDAVNDPNLYKVDEEFKSGVNGLTANVVLAQGDYCVYETVIPVGYKSAPVTKWTVTANGAELKLVNNQVGTDTGDLPALPITGAAGQVLMVAGGVALLSVAGGLLLMRRKRSAASL
ncbi:MULTISPECIES: SpaH/EbpB family LPXTG-anchored major pilin [unclassified Leucobacter]|uniref:SpaH/EbpB family LPXTG-anchored major pilin n=1 Tax=unclassified Leucobacter TaxID=2621730 RepID=UPI0030198065